jgi:hypothetical protein
MRQRALLNYIAAMALVGLAPVVGAQGLPPPGGFGPGPAGPMEGSFEFGRLVGGFGGKTVLHKPFQATFTITRTASFQDNTITNKTTGMVARGDDGSTYRRATFPAIGPWEASGKPQEFVYIRNTAKQMTYVVTNGKYTALPIPPQGSSPGGNSGPGMQGAGPSWRGAGNVTVRNNPSATYTDGAVIYKVDNRVTTRTIPAGQIGNQKDIVITTERWYSPELEIVLQETHNDPRFGTSTYQLTNISIGAPSVSFLPDPSLRLVQPGRLTRNPRGPGKGPMPPSP